MKTYEKKLQDPRWQRFRLQILNRDNFRCTQCGNSRLELHVHHEHYSGQPWEVPPEQAKTLCADCHKNRHVKIPVLENMLLERSELEDKIRNSENKYAINTWFQAIRIMDREIEKYYPQKVKEVA